jgi:hypothetical protein
MSRLSHQDRPVLGSWDCSMLQHFSASAAGDP